jgi:prepilin-type N-terminal cleavage/methylation domain-containing protein
MKGDVKETVQGQSGVTLVELLIVLAIIGILVVVGVNMMGGVVSKQRLRSATDEVKTRIRAAQLLAVVKNIPVTVVFDSGSDSYWACLDSDHDGDCTDGEEYLSLDSGRTGTPSEATFVLDRVSIYNAVFGTDASDNFVTFNPPSGLPEPIMDGTDYVYGAVCLQAEPGDEGEDYDVQYNFRRVTVDPIVGKTKIWKNKAGITELPECESQLPETDPSAIWNAIN